MTVDSGLAPNPFWDSCTLALCTPNHMNAKLEPGDWIVGHTSKKQGRKLVHAMKVTKILDMTSYYHRYPQKRPNPNGTRQQQCGDNMYYRKENQWFRHPSQCHNSTDNFCQDINRPVFIAEGPENFIYFGKTASDIPECLSFLVQERHGIAYVHDNSDIEKFENWFNKLKKGRVGEPRDSLPQPPPRYLRAVEAH